MGASFGKRRSHGFKRSAHVNILKKDISDFLSEINFSTISYKKHVIITQAEMLMSRTLNYFEDKEDKIPFLERQVPPAYDEENNERNINNNQFREYMKRVVLYLQYFLEL